MAEESLYCLLNQRRYNQCKEIQLRLASHERQVAQEEQAKEQEQNRVANKVIMRSAEKHAKVLAKNWAGGAQPIEWEP